MICKTPPAAMTAPMPVLLRKTDIPFAGTRLMPAAAEPRARSTSAALQRAKPASWHQTGSAWGILGALPGWPPMSPCRSPTPAPCVHPLCSLVLGGQLGAASCPGAPSSALHPGHGQHADFIPISTFQEAPAPGALGLSEPSALGLSKSVCFQLLLLQKTP